MNQYPRSGRQLPGDDLQLLLAHVIAGQGQIVSRCSRGGQTEAAVAVPAVSAPLWFAYIIIKPGGVPAGWSHPSWGATEPGQRGRFLFSFHIDNHIGAELPHCAHKTQITDYPA